MSIARRDAARIDELLPQTQCRRCGFDGCMPYAEAIATGNAQINRCPPGGEATLAALAALLAVPAPPLDTRRGEPGRRHVARIETSACIGCTKCILACPVDAIIGAPKHQHHVLADRCTGCDLCLPPCPTDCIVTTPASGTWTDTDAARGRRNHQARLRRGSPPPTAADVSARTVRDPLIALAAPGEKSRRLAAIRARLRSGPTGPLR